MSDIAICSSALVLVGANPITSFDEGTTESITAQQIYESEVRSMMGAHPWRFCFHTAQLSRLTQKGERYEAVYDLPSDLIELRAVHINQIPVRFERFARRVELDASPMDRVMAEYIRRVPTEEWPATFRQVMVFQMASQLAVPVAGDEQLGVYYEQRTEKMMLRAKSMMAQGTGTRRMRGQRLTRYR